jgi:DNA-binding response OmpR family regulator
MEVLIVDDDELFCETLAKVLRREGHVVYVASTALEATDLSVRQPQIKLAVIDWMLGGTMTGLDLGRAFRRQGMATFLVSGYSKEEIRLKWRDPLEGFLGFFSKGDMGMISEILERTERVEKSLEGTKP